MVKLERIVMNGFKSFVSTTEFAFGPGITAVVGPNGCGKSNIADAINWVIGERSSKTLRADHMGDVIFNGTENRRPLGMAEVSLVLGGHAKDILREILPDGARADAGANGNANGNRNGQDPADDSFPPAEEDRIRISRRIFRSGENEYLIDGRKVRLKDIQELLARVGVGTGVYSIIEQGRIDRVISARPRDRRVLIEEAAGIALYKIRKRQAQSKLESTEANLARINDIVSEQERQINALKRQAARARRYARLNEAIDRSERILLRHEAVRLEGLGSDLRARHDEAAAAESASAAALGAAEAGLQEARERAARESLRHQEARDALHDLDRAIDQIRREVERSREQESAAAEQIERSEREVAGIEGRLREGAARRGDLERRLEEATAQRATIDSDVESAATSLRLDSAALHEDETSLASAREDLVGVASAVSDARNEIQRLEERRTALTAEMERLGRDVAGLSADRDDLAGRISAHAVRCGEAEDRLSQARREARATTEGREAEEARREAIVVDREKKRGILEGVGERLAALRDLEQSARAAHDAFAESSAVRVLKDLLTPPERLDRAVDIALRGLLRGYVTSTPDEAFALLTRLKEQGRGRAVVIPEQPAAPGAGEPAAPATTAGSPESLWDLLGEGTRSITALRPLLRRVLVAPDLEEALRLRRASPGFEIVTLQGDLLSADGWMEGGAELPEEAGVMTLKRLLDRLGSEADRTRMQIGELGGSLRESEERLSALRAREVEWLRRADELGREVEALRHRGESLGEESARLDLRRDVHAGESGRVAEDLSASEAGLAEARLAMARALDVQEELQRFVESLTGRAADLRAALRTRQEALGQLREQAASARVAQTALETELRHQIEAIADLERRRDHHREERASWETRRAEAAGRIGAEGSRLSDRMADRILAEGAVAAASAAADEMRQELEALEGRVSGARQELESARERVHGIALEVERLAGDRRNLDSKVAERGWTSLAAATAELTAEDCARGRDEVETELTDLRSRREAMGAVNLMAMEQYRELEERYAFVTAQRRDLEESISSLKETIARINRQSRERFMTAFERIRASFSELYTILFRGGRADLRLAQEDEGETDILEAGLEISAQPPGKRLQSISLLSGGEKALTALALLFAIFKHSASPFCLLDEVDAALDELNVARYVSLLKEMAGETQFIVITHSRRTMEEADTLYGVTMEEPGVSRAVSVVMGSPEERREAARSLPEQLAARHRGHGAPPPGAPRRPALPEA